MTEESLSPTEREMFDEINALIESVAKALDTSPVDVVTAIEQGRLGMELMTDEGGVNFLRVDYEGRQADIRQGMFMRHDQDGE